MDSFINFRFILKSALIIAIGVVLRFPAFGFDTGFKRNEIVFPCGQKEVETFLALLKNPKNAAVVGIEKTKYNFKDIPHEGSVEFFSGDGDFLLYLEDLNNDGKKEYVLIWLHGGSANTSGVKGAFQLNGKTLTSLHFDEDVSKSISGHTNFIKKFPLYLAAPFVIKRDGKNYLRYWDGVEKKIHVYLWEHTQFTEMLP